MELNGAALNVNKPCVTSRKTAFLKDKEVENEKLWLHFYKFTSSPLKLRFPQNCILGEWLYNVTKGVGRVYSVSKKSVGCSKVCGNGSKMECP